MNNEIAASALGYVGKASTIAEIPLVQKVGTLVFALALVHTLVAGRINAYSHRFPKDSIRSNILHFLGEVEVVFGIWAVILMGWVGSMYGSEEIIGYLSTVNFTEPVFVFVIMAMTATRPIIDGAAALIGLLARAMPLPPAMAFYASAMFFGSLLGSFITEPAAMTVVALLLRDRFFDKNHSAFFKYLTVGLLFVSISIGGTLTHFAAPPVLMVAGPWNWDMSFMFFNFGWKAAVAIAVGVALTCVLARKDLMLPLPKKEVVEPGVRTPMWLIVSHLLFVALVVAYHSHVVFFVPIFLLFLGWVEVTRRHQELVQFRSALLVGFFLGGLVTLGKLQGWWLQPLISSMDSYALYFSALGLTAITDNAAITYLGTLVPDLDARSKYLLVAGAVAGGGLTVIANAPNPAGFRILGERFGAKGIEPQKLFLAALPFTILATLAFLLL
jgi:hypothetical protein